MCVVYFLFSLLRCGPAHRVMLHIRKIRKRMETVPAPIWSPDDGGRTKRSTGKRGRGREGREQRGQTEGEEEWMEGILLT